MKASEKLSVYGSRSLSDLEILEVIVRDAAAARSLWELCDGELSALVRLLPHEMMAVAGIGPITASIISGAVELGKRASVKGPVTRGSNRIGKPSDLVQFLRGQFGALEYESFVAVGIDSRQNVVIVRTVGVGSVSQVDVHPRELFRDMVRACVHSCILAHNHPSGCAEASESDIELTSRMCEAGRLMGIPVLDHVIFTDTDFLSFAASGLM
jgi:DNA repair protein RadC